MHNQRQDKLVALRVPVRDVVFIVDTSAEMGVCQSGGASTLDLVKMEITHFIRERSKKLHSSQPGTYSLVTFQTGSAAVKCSRVPGSLPCDEILVELNRLEATDTSDLPHALDEAFSLLNSRRLSDNVDTYGLGRAMVVSPALVFVFTAAQYFSSPQSGLLKGFQSTHGGRDPYTSTFYRWDQRIFSFVFKLKGKGVVPSKVERLGDLSERNGYPSHSLFTTAPDTQGEDVANAASSSASVGFAVDALDPSLKAVEEVDALEAESPISPGGGASSSSDEATTEVEREASRKTKECAEARSSLASMFERLGTSKGDSGGKTKGMLAAALKASNGKAMATDGSDNPFYFGPRKSQGTSRPTTPWGGVEDEDDSRGLNGALKRERIVARISPSLGGGTPSPLTPPALIFVSHISRKTGGNCFTITSREEFRKMMANMVMSVTERPFLTIDPRATNPDAGKDEQQETFVTSVGLSLMIDNLPPRKDKIPAPRKEIVVARLLAPGFSPAKRNLSTREVLFPLPDIYPPNGTSNSQLPQRPAEARLFVNLEAPLPFPLAALNSSIPGAVVPFGVVGNSKILQALHAASTRGSPSPIRLCSRCIGYGHREEDCPTYKAFLEYRAARKRGERPPYTARYQPCKSCFPPTGGGGKPSAEFHTHPACRAKFGPFQRLYPVHVIHEETKVDPVTGRTQVRAFRSPPVAVLCPPVGEGQPEMRDLQGVKARLISLPYNFPELMGIVGSSRGMGGDPAKQQKLNDYFSRVPGYYLRGLKELLGNHYNVPEAPSTRTTEWRKTLDHERTESNVSLRHSQQLHHATKTAARRPILPTPSVAAEACGSVELGGLPQGMSSTVTECNRVAGVLDAPSYKQQERTGFLWNRSRLHGVAPASLDPGAAPFSRLRSGAWAELSTVAEANDPVTSGSAPPISEAAPKVSLAMASAVAMSTGGLLMGSSSGGEESSGDEGTLRSVSRYGGSVATHSTALTTRSMPMRVEGPSAVVPSAYTASSGKEWRRVKFLANRNPVEGMKLMRAHLPVSRMGLPDTNSLEFKMFSERYGKQFRPTVEEAAAFQQGRQMGLIRRQQMAAAAISASQETPMLAGAPPRPKRLP